jgi:hypothetical protein
MLVPQGPTDAVLNRPRRGLPSRSSKSDIKPLSTFPSSILHLPTLSFLAQSQIKALNQIIEPPS